MGTHPIFESDFDCLTECQRYIICASSTTPYIVAHRSSRNRSLLGAVEETRAPKLAFVMRLSCSNLNSIEMKSSQIRACPWDLAKLVLGIWILIEAARLLPLATMESVTFIT